MTPEELDDAIQAIANLTPEPEHKGAPMLHVTPTLQTLLEAALPVAESTGTWGNLMGVPVTIQAGMVAPYLWDYPDCWCDECTHNRIAAFMPEALERRPKP